MADANTPLQAARQLLELLQRERACLESREFAPLTELTNAKNRLIGQLRELDPDSVLSDAPLAEALRATRDANAINGRIIARVRAANRALLETLTGQSHEPTLYAASGDTAAHDARRDLARA